MHVSNCYASYWVSCLMGFMIILAIIAPSSSYRGTLGYTTTYLSAPTETDLTIKFNIVVPDTIASTASGMNFPFATQCELFLAGSVNQLITTTPLPPMMTTSTTTLLRSGSVVDSFAYECSFHNLTPLSPYSVAISFWLPYITPLIFRSSGALYTEMTLLANFQGSNYAHGYFPASVQKTTTGTLNGGTIVHITVSGLNGFRSSPTATNGLHLGKMVSLTFSSDLQSVYACQPIIHNGPVVETIQYLFEPETGNITFPEGFPPNMEALRIVVTIDSEILSTLSTLPYTVSFYDGTVRISMSNTSQLVIVESQIAQIHEPLLMRSPKLAPNRNYLKPPRNTDPHHISLTITTSIEVLTVSTEHVFTLDMPTMYARSAAITDCQVTGGSSGVTMKSTGIGALITFYPSPAPFSAIITCYVIPNPIFASLKSSSGSSHDLFAPEITLKRGRDQSSPVIIPQIPFFQGSVVTGFPPSLMEQPIKVYSYPQNYGLVNSYGVATWIVEVHCTGSYLDLLPKIKISSHNNAQIFQSLVITPLVATAYTGILSSGLSSSSIYTTQLSSIPIMVDTSTREWRIIRKKVSEIPETMALIDIRAFFEISLTPDQFPSSQDPDFRYFPSNTITSLDDLKLKVDIYPDSTMQTSLHNFDVILDPAFIPKVTITKDNHPINPITLPNTGYTMFNYDFAYHTTPSNLPPSDLRSTYSSDSIWNLFTDCQFFIDSIITLKASLSNGCSFPQDSPNEYNFNHDSNIVYAKSPSFDSTNVYLMKLSDPDASASSTNYGLTQTFSLQFPIDCTQRTKMYTNIETTALIQRSTNNPVEITTVQSLYFFTPQLQDLKIAASLFSKKSSITTSIQLLLGNNNIQPPVKSVYITGHSILRIQFTIGAFDSVDIALWRMTDTTPVQVAQYGTLSALRLTLENESLHQSAISDVFIRYTFHYDATKQFTTATHTEDSVLFDIDESCTGPDPSDSSIRIDLCTEPDHICQESTNTCILFIPDIKTNPTPTIPLDRPAPPTTDRCPSCDPTNTAMCTVVEQNNIISIEKCACKDGWSGLTCQQSTSCDPKKSKCNPDNGYALPLPGSTKCESKCHCYNQWAGLSCQTCQLQCFNDGIAYNDCARCGCQEGYSGSQCQCQAVNAKLTLIHGTNDIIIKTDGKLSTSSASSLSFNINPEHLDKDFIFPNQLIDNDYKLIKLLRTLFSAFQSTLTSSTNGYYSMTVMPSEDKKSTEFHFNILFNCNAYNPSITSLDHLKTLWSKFVEVFTTNEVILDNFIISSPSGEVEITHSDLQPSSESLPPSNERLVNHSNSLFSYQCVMMMIVLFYISIIS